MHQGRWPLSAILVAVGLLSIHASSSHGYQELRNARFVDSRPRSAEQGLFELFPAAEGVSQAGDGVLDPYRTSPPIAGPPAGPPDFRELMRPVWSFGAEWQSKTMGVSIGSYEAAVRLPTYPFWGPPPPFWSTTLTVTDIHAPPSLDLPSTLYDATVGGAWVRPINDVWTVRVFASVAYTSDGDASSSEAWRVRGGGFAIYKPNEQWTFLVGALALGRNDIPVVPALGAIWAPHSRLRVDLTLPRPRVSWAFLETDARQQWVYVGGGFNGGTWAYETNAGLDDVITFRDWRLVLGWESTPIKPPGAFIVRGTQVGAEIAYVFAREFEFDSGRADLQLDDAILFRTTLRF